MRPFLLRIGLLFALLAMTAPLQAAKPKAKGKAKPKTPPSQNLPALDGDTLHSGQFNGVLVRLPNNDRMFTLKVYYPEVRLRPGAKPPNLRSMEAKAMQQMLQQMNRAQHAPRGRTNNRGRANNRGRGYRGRGHHHYSAVSGMMQMEQRYMQQQQRMAQAMMRAQQKEVQLLRQEIQAIQKAYEVVQATRDVDFQIDAEPKVRIKSLPEAFDDKGNIKSYTAQEKAALKGKNRNLPGYESSSDALKIGQVVQVWLQPYKKPRPKPAPGKPVAVKKDKASDADNPIAPIADAPLGGDNVSTQHKMQVKMIVIVAENADALKNAAKKSAKKKRK